MTSTVEKTIPQILEHYNLDANAFEVKAIGSGHIHYTFKIEGDKCFVLQRVNKNVFKKPEIIASNINAAATYLQKIDPSFLFLTPVATNRGEQMAYDTEGYPWRLFPYFENTFTVDKVDSKEQAKSAASEFARLTKKLARIDTKLFEETIPRFHDLTWRNDQFKTALTSASSDRIEKAAGAITKAKHFSYLVNQYVDLIYTGSLQLRITHNDTKINNILFNSESRKAICAIDLDTLMPGYFIYDIGDMFRTFVSPVDEEEKDLSKVRVRREIYDAVAEGYLSQMNDELSVEEKKAIPFAGLMMTYIMALRMLTDFLNGDVYYHTTYPGQNLVRAENQLRLLEELEKVIQ